MLACCLRMKLGTTRRRALGVLLAAVLSHAPGRADASDAPATQRVSAEALFDDAIRLMKAGKFAEACPKLEDSQKLDPGVGTLLYLGECYEKLGRSASAWATFREAASAAESAGQAKRVKIARERGARVEQKLAYLTIEVADATRALPGLRVRRDGVETAPSLIGSAVPVDPGSISVEAQAPGYEPFSITVNVEPSGRQSVLVPVLTPRAAEPAAVVPPAVALTAPPVPASVPPPPAPVAPPPPAPERGNAQRWIGISLGGLGLVGVGVGTYFGLRAIDQDEQADAGSCDDSVCQDADDFEHAESANDAAVAANIAFAAGGALLATGIVVYLSAPSGPSGSGVRLEPRIGPSFAGLAVGGRL
jgi:hypothetical protein